MSVCRPMNEVAVSDAAQRLASQRFSSVLTTAQPPHDGSRGTRAARPRGKVLPAAKQSESSARWPRNTLATPPEMRRLPRLSLWALMLCLGGGLFHCGGAAKEQRPQTSKPVERAESALPTEAAPVAVAAPSNLVAYGQIAAPGKFADKVLAVAVPGLEWREVAESQIPGFTDAFLTSATVGLGVLLQGDALAPHLQGAYALPVADAQKLLELLPRVDEVARPLTTRRTQVGSSCVLVEALGAAPYRLVCGIGGLPAPALIDYLRASIHKAPAPDGDIDLFVDLNRLQKRYEPLLGLLEGGSESPIAPLLQAFPKVKAALPATIAAWRSSLEALEQGRLRITLKDNRLQGRASLTLREGDSWLYRHSTQAAASVGAVPEAFWKVPSDATSTVAYLPGESVTPGPALGPLVIAYLEDTHAPAPIVTFSDTLIESFTKNEGAVHATGHILKSEDASTGPAVSPTEPEPSDADSSLNGLGAIALNYIGEWRSEWSLSVSSSALADVRTQTGQLLAILKDRASKRYLGDLLGQEALEKVWPKGRIARLGPKDRASKDDFIVTLTFPKPAPAKGAKKAPKAKVDTTYFFAVMRGGDATYSGTGPDRKALIARMKKFMAGTAESATAESTTVESTTVESTLGNVEEARLLQAQQGRSFGYFRMGSLVLKGLHEAGVDLDPRLGALFETAGIRFWSSAGAERAGVREVDLNLETNFDTLVSVILTSLEARARASEH